MAGIWTEELVSKLRQLFEQNFSGRLIADHLGLTRNQVIGKLARIGLVRVGPTIGMSKPARTPSDPTIRLKRPSRAAYYELAQADVVPLHAALLDLSANQCRYPYGDGPFTFCGCQKIEGSSYCEPHHQLTHGNNRPTAEQVAMNKRAYRANLISVAA